MVDGPSHFKTARWNLLLNWANQVERPVFWTGKIVSWLYLPLIGVILLDALTRKFIRKLSFVVESDLHFLLNSPVFQDLEWHFHSVLFLCALSYAYAYNAHVRLDIFRPHIGVQGRLWVEFIGGLVLLLPFLGIFCWYAWDFFFVAWAQDEGSGSSTGIENRWFIKFFVFVGPLLLILSGLSKLLRLYVRLFGPEDLHTQTRLGSITNPSDSAFN